MKKNWVLSQESFNALLDWLDSDREQAGIRYEEIRRSLIRIFINRGCDEAEDLADETINRVVSKLDEIKKEFTGDPARYFYGVANKVSLEYQVVYGHVDVEGVNLEGVNPIANNFVTVFVQSAINQKVNPLLLVNEPQLSLMIPVKASNGAVKARAKDVRAEVLDGSLKLHLTYEFQGVREGAAG